MKKILHKFLILIKNFLIKFKSAASYVDWNRQIIMILCMLLYIVGIIVFGDRAPYSKSSLKHVDSVKSMLNNN